MIQVDSKRQAIVLNDEGSRSTKHVSGRKIRANRRNGPQSKGPKTDSGKKRSSRNSTTHGSLASGRVPIDRGPFTEDSQAFYQRLEATVDSLAPRDAIEERVALQIAGKMNLSDRLDALETASYESAAHSVQNQRSDLRNEEELGESEARARGLYYYLAGVPQNSDIPYQSYAVLMRAMGPKPGLRIRNRWDDEHAPSSDDEWKKMLHLLIKTLWPTPEEATVWAYQLSARLENEWAAAEGRERELVAERVLDGPFDKVTRYDGRITNGLARLLAIYEKLQARRLPRHGSNEPNSEEE